MIRKKILTLLNICMVLLAVTGTVIMLNSTKSATGLTASGVENLKYFTVLSNEFCGLVAVYSLFLSLFDHAKGTSGTRRHLILLKLVSATAVALTFSVIAFFLGPLYGHSILYRGSNLIFHLLLPLLAMAELIFMDPGEQGISFSYTLVSVIPIVLYGLSYLINILVNGVGTWPNTNDWYGFVNWGLPVGLGIFSGIILAGWGLACLLRFLNKKVHKR